MKALRKISPIEHRLHNRTFNIDCSPHNYFEKMRLEIMFGQLFTWFLERYGIYFFIQRARVVDDTILLQLHYYKTFYHTKFIKNLSKRTKVLGGQIAWQAAKHVSSMSSAELASIKQSAADLSSLKYFGSKALFKRSLKFASSGQSNTILRAKAVRQNKLQQLAPGIKMFFNQFFASFLGYRSIVLVKPIYQTFYLNPLLKAEFEKVLKTTKYLRKRKWSFDLLFLVHYGITTADLNYALSFFARQMYNTPVQKPMFKIFFGLMEKFYFMKTNIRGMKLQVKGAWDRHGRTHIYEQVVGDVGLTDSNSLVVYDSIDLITRYGAITMRFWIHYWSVKNLDFLSKHAKITFDETII